MNKEIKDPNSPKGPKQASALWRLEMAISKNKPQDWYKSGINKGNASDLIGRMIQYKDGDLGEDQIENLCTDLQFWSYNFDFKEVIPAQPAKIETVIETKEVLKTVNIASDMDLSKVIETLAPVAKGITHIQDLFDAKVPELPTVKVSKTYHKPGIFDTVLATLTNTDVNTLLYGQAGCGKTLMFREMAKALELPFYVVSCNGRMTSSQLFTRDELYIDTKTGQNATRTVFARPMQAIQKPGIVLFDEVFTLMPDLFASLNGLFEPSTRTIETELGQVKSHPECFIALASNTNGRVIDRNFTAANRVDASALDRVVSYTLGYSSEAEKQLLNQLPKVARDKITSWLKDLRQGVKQNNISFSPSTRRLTSCISLVAKSNLSPKVAFEASFMGQLSDVERKKINLNLDSENTTEG